MGVGPHAKKSTSRGLAASGGGAPRAIKIDDAVSIASQIATALETAHAAGIIHRDVKPANIMASESGQIKVLDFGVSKVLHALEENASTAAVTAATAAGQIVGTLAYMSPEQVQGRPIDARSDIYSFGAVMYELLTGRRPFVDDGSLALVSAILTGTPPPIATLRPEVPADLAALVDACLAKDRAVRPSAHEIVGRLTAIREKASTRLVPASSLLRRRAVLVPVAIVLLAIAAGGWMWWNANARVRWVRNVAIPEIERFMARDDNDGAFRIAREAIAVLPDDPYVKQLWVDTTFLVTFESEPSGAEVSVKGYLAHDAEWIPIGRTPLENVRVPYAHVRTRLTKPGFTPLEASLSSFKVKYTLDPEGTTPSGMVRAQAGTASVGGTILPVDDFWIDRLEVTNQEFKTFVDRGGYEKPEYLEGAVRREWTHALIRRGDDAVSRRDRPRRSVDVGARHLPGGSGQPAGHRGELDEAAAYAAYAGKVLPTAYHWTRAAGARGGFTENFSEILYLSNFGGKGRRPAARIEASVPPARTTWPATPRNGPPAASMRSG